MKRITVIDLFAGPGGLGEGFASFRDSRGSHPFGIGLSIEKDPVAHQTLELRAFYREFLGSGVPPQYYQHVRGAITREVLFDAFPQAARAARQEAWQHTLESETAESAGDRIAAVLKGNEDWLLIGGPPCQAYSLVGRSRNRGIKGYVPEDDHRQTLYLEYLQILADHGPPVFVMENVKGLLSATFGGQGLFERIRADLEDPVQAIRRSGRRPRKGAPARRYRICTLAPYTSLVPDRPQDFVLRAEEFGIPQARHRVILLGIRDDLPSAPEPLVVVDPPPTVEQAIGDLPRIRSGVSGEEDSAQRWREILRSSRRSEWGRELSADGMKDTATAVKDVVDQLSLPKKDRGAEFVSSSKRCSFRSDWFHDDSLRGVLNHSSRSHIPSDLHRYLFASAYASETGKSPDLAAFPPSLRPQHRNVAMALEGGMFADRFRVQLASRPATTVTSHISKDGHYYIHYDPTQCRSLTVREAARLQTFPDNYFFCGGRTAQYQQVGNAVPPLLAQQIAAAVYGLLG